jgi:replicative DNA helicase
MSKKINRDSFSHLGIDFQIRLVGQLLNDEQFAESILDIIDPNYFNDQSLKLITSLIKEVYEQYQIIPDVGSIEFRVLDKVTNEIDQKCALAQLKAISEANLNDSLSVQDYAMKFCKQQELTKSIKIIQAIIDKGDIEKYDECEEILKKALEHGDTKDNGINVTDNIDDVLSDDYRKPIPTGIRGLDELMDGGLSKGELGVILAPFGVGKTTMLTKIANTAKDLGYNVLQIFFEDMPKQIQRKHLACWSGIDLNSFALHKEQLKELAAQKDREPGELKLKKFSSDGTTIPMIRAYIRKLMAKGFKPDIVLLDYIDVVQPSKKYDDVNVGEGSVMRQFETMLSEMNMVGWTAVQGNRSSIKAEVVESDQMGGSIKKGQIGHFIISLAKTLDQRDNGTATAAILKSRFSKSGIILQDIIFNNSTVQVDMSEQSTVKTRTEFVKDKQQEQQNTVTALLNSVQKRKNVLGGGDQGNQ